MRYFRNDKLDLVNREKQRFGFRKLSSGKIASVLLGVTIFGSFALNGQVVKADTPTDGSQTSAAVVKANNDSQTNAVVDEPKSTQNNKGQGATATFNKEEQSGQDTSAQNYGSHSSLTITSEGGEETTEAKTGNIQADSTGTDRGGTPSDKNGARVIRIARLAAMQPAAGIPVSDQPTAEKMAKKYTHIDVDHAQKILDYYNNIGTITKILDLDSSNYSYGGPWLEGIIGLKTPNVETFTNSYVNRFVGIYTGNMVKDTQAKIDERIKNLQDLSSQYPNNQEIKDAINKLTDIKNSVTASNITNAKAMENVIDTLDHYGSEDEYNKLEKKADLKTEIDAAKALADDPKYYNSTNKDAFDKALSDAETVYGNGSATQQEVDDAKKALADAKTALNGSATDKAALQSAVKEADTVKGDSKYYNAKNKDDYDKALAAAQKVIDNPAATQQEVDDAKKALADAKTALNGSATDKAALQSAVKEADTVKGDSKYYNAKNKDDYDKALAAAQKVIDNPAATQQEVDDAKKALADAKTALNGSATDKAALQSAVKEADTVKGDSKYYNAKNKDDYDKALAAAQKVIDNPAATQQEVDDAKKALADAKTALNGSATDKAALQSAVKEADTVKGDSKYYNAKNKDDYDKALAAAQKVIDNPAATQQEVDDAKKALADAKTALNGSATDKAALQSAVKEADTVKGDSKYYNAKNKDDYDKALAAAQKVIDNPAATQQEVDDAKKALADAKTALNGSATDKAALQSAVKEADTVKGDSKYYNAKNKDDYDKALAAAQKVIDNPAATQQEVDDAKKALADAKTALNGSATDKAALQSAVKEADTVKGDSKYYNAKNKDDYDKALAAAQKVIDNPAATQQEVDDAKKALADAKTALNGSATDKAALQSAVKEADTVKGDSKYYNAKNKDDYDKALAAAQKVIDNPAATQQEVDDAKKALADAKTALNGSATDKAALQSAVKEADTVKGDSKYYNAKNKDDYDKALAAAQKVIDNPAATQQEVDDAKKALADAKTALNGSATDKAALQSAVKEADTVKGDSKYYNAKNKDDYDKALAAAQKVIDNPAATQQEVDDAKKALADAKTALNGSATDKAALQSAVKEADTVKGDSKYYNAKNKDDYDKALAAAQKVIDNPAATQQEVDDAKKALADAKTALNGSATDKAALQSAVKEADTVKGDSKYYNAKNKDDYDKALAAAQKVIDNPAATQQEVDDAKKALADAKTALNGSATDKAALQSAVKEADTVKGDSKYYNAKNKDDYDKALAAAQKVIDNPAATQQEVDDAKKALADAKTALNGSATDKAALQSAVKEADTVKGDSKYYNAKNKDDYDKALAAAQKVIDNPAATQQEVDDAKKALADAKTALNGSATDKAALQSAVKEADTVKGDSKYYNAKNKDDYDKALAAAQKVIDNPAATQQEVDDAKKALADAKTALNGSATDKAALQSAVKEADTVKGDSKYYNAKNKDDYDKALAAAQKVIDNPAATQQEVDDAKKALADAKTALNGSATDKAALQSAVKEADTVKGDSKYYNAKNKDDYDKALAAAQKVIDNPAATQQEVDDAKKALADAKTALNGSATDKAALQSAVKEADTVKGDSKYYNAKNKDDYDKALAAAQKVIDNPAATQQEVDDAKKALADAKTALNGSATDKAALQSAVKEADTVKGDSKYYNAKNKDDYDKALAAAQKVIDNPAATQQEVDDAKKALADAKTALNGSATDKAALQSAVKEADTVKGDSKYYNAKNKDDYDKALAAAQKVIDNPAATQQEVDDAKKALADAKTALNGSATDKAALQSAVKEADTVKGDSKYYNAKNKDDYDKALAAAQKVIDNPAATQQEVDDAKKALADAKTALNGSATDKAALQSAVKEADTVKGDSKYYNAKNKDDYDKALAAAQKVIDNPAATQQEVDDAKKALADAKTALNGSATDKAALQSAVKEADTVKGDSKYYNAKNKDDYDKALAAAQKVIDNPAATQQEVDDAKKALADAKTALNGSATDKAALQSAVKEANTTKLDDKYYNAGQDKKQAYDEALAQATKLLNDKTASQKAVDDAVANLEKAKAELNGEPNFIGGDYTPSEPSTLSTETPAEKTTEKILMHASYLYDNKGIKIDKPTVKSYVTVVVAENPVTISGIKYYKVAGKDEYIKAGNIDGTLRVITHNSYIYNNKGKATRNKGIKRLVKKTRIVRTYGALINIKDHMMYRIAKNRYIKARNFEGTLRRLSHNSFVYDENGKATRNKGIRRLLKKSRVVRTFDAPVKINGHMMYRVDNGYVKVKNFK